MRLFSPLRCRAGRCALVALVLALGLSVLSGRGRHGPVLFAQFVQVQFPGAAVSGVANEEPYNVYLPTDRTLSRGMSRAHERLMAREYNEALGFLQRVLDEDEDTFLGEPGDAESRRGIKATARQMIANLPPAGREMYELLHASGARRQLESALSSGDREELRQLVRRYLFTPAGFEAAMILAQMELDRGHPLSAAYIYQQLAEDSRGAAPYEPQLSLMAAISWTAAGQTARAAATLRDLAARFAGAEVELAGRATRLPPANASDARLVAWLAQSVGRPQSTQAGQHDWLTQRGAANRNAERSGGAPHLSARWEARVVNDPRFESLLTSRAEQFRQQGLVAIPAARPIAIGDVVVMRTPQNVVAVDWTTGKRLWETREEEPDVREQILVEYMSGNARENWSFANHPLEQRVWDDSLSTALASDGERVFAIGGMSLANREDNVGWAMGGPFGGPFDAATSPTNRLAAYELATEGKLAWEIDGANATDDLAGAFFLGPPLAVDGALYVLAEIRSAVYLVALEPNTGRLQWRQQLAGLELGITLDPQRRLSGVTPSEAAGVLVCPTSAGVVVAVDLIRREFAWVYRYPRQVESYVQVRPGWHGRPEAALVRDNNRWLDGTPVIAEGRVFLTPPDSADLHCVDLSSGELIWKQPRDKALFLACVDRGNVLLVGADSVTAVRAVDRTPAWPKERVELPNGALPAGTGYLSEGRYYLPLTSGQVLAIDTQDGSTTGATGTLTTASVGNLICHRGSVLSQSALVLDKYDQIEVLRQRAEAALAANPRDAAAIRDLAEMRRLDGAMAEAVAMLKQAMEIEPDDPLTREMLADYLLAAMAADYSTYAHDLPLLRQIVARPEQRIELLRIEAIGLEAAGQTIEAFSSLVQLAEATAADPLELTLGPCHTARSDCWIQARSRSIWSAATADDRTLMADRLAEWRGDWNGAATRGQKRTYLAHFDGLPGADDVRLELARELLKERELLEAQLELLKLERSATNEYRAAAAVLMTQWLLISDRVDEARRLAESAAAEGPAAPVFDGKTPQQLLDEWHIELTGNADESSRPWPRGRATAEVQPASTSGRRSATRRAAAEYQLGMRRLRIEQVYRPTAATKEKRGAGTAWSPGSVRLGAAQWLIAQDGTRLVGRNAAGRDIFRFNAEREPGLRRFAGNSDWLQAARVGDLLYVTLGGQILALDTRRRADNGEDVLWQAFPAGRFPAMPARGGVPRTWARSAAQDVYHPWSERKRARGQAAVLIGSLGPVTPDGVVIQEQFQLRCVDPLSGETRWSRTDIPAGSELFGDDELLLAANFGESQVYVLRPEDGELVERRPMPATPWLLTSGRNVCQLIDKPTERGIRKIVRVIDAATGEQRLETEYGPLVRMTTIEPNLVAVVEPPDLAGRAQSPGTIRPADADEAATPPGRFHLIDVAAGRLRIDQPLPEAAVPRSLHVLEAGDQLFLCVNSATRQQPSRPLGPDFPLINGQVYAFDLETGEACWPKPATVERRGIMLTQPLDIPLLMFADRQLKRDASGGGTQLRLLCLDKTTGATVYRHDELPDTAGSHFRVRAVKGDPRAVSIEMSARTVRLTFSERPRAPEPPTDDRVEAPRKGVGRGLWGVTQRMGDAIQGAIENPAADPWQDGDVQPLDDD